MSDSRRIYVASSWRNERQPEVVKGLRDCGHAVYDFRNPRPGDTGFAWSEIDPDWKSWTNRQYLDALNHPLARDGYDRDFAAMQWADTFVLVLPCGRSAHLELGWACGRGKQTLILLDEMEPELMARMVDHICLDLNEVATILGTPVEVKPTLIVDGKTAWEFACGWYSTSEFLDSLNRRVDPVEVPKDQSSPEFAEFLCENSRLAMRKGIELGWRAAMRESKADTCAEELLPITSDWIKSQGARLGPRKAWHGSNHADR